MNDPVADRLQFDLHELTQRVELLERVAPAMPDDVTARLDRLCREMTQFQLEVLELLSKMAPQTPSGNFPERPAPAPCTNLVEREETPDISVGWIGSARKA